MNPAIVLAWLDELTALFWLLPVAVVLSYLRRRAQGHAGFTARDWRFLFGHPREKVLTARLWLGFAALWLAVVLVGLGIAFYVLPFGSWWFDGAVLLAIAGILFITPQWLRCS
jgi:hypothetical protein